MHAIVLLLRHQRSVAAGQVASESTSASRSRLTLVEVGPGTIGIRPQSTTDLISANWLALVVKIVGSRVLKIAVVGIVEHEHSRQAVTLVDALSGFGHVAQFVDDGIASAGQAGDDADA